MKKHIFIFILGIFTIATQAFAQSDLKIVMIRHGEKPFEGDNLTCKGLNRALQLPKVLHAKFGVPNYTYVPKLSNKAETKHARMFETVTPMAVKYNLNINSQFDKDDAEHVAADILTKKGTVLMVWEHHALTDIVRALGVKDKKLWNDNDFDSIWIITFKDGVATMTTDTEGLSPSDECPN